MSYLPKNCSFSLLSVETLEEDEPAAASHRTNNDIRREAFSRRVPQHLLLGATGLPTAPKPVMAKQIHFRERDAGGAMRIKVKFFVYWGICASPKDAQRSYGLKDRSLSVIETSQRSSLDPPLGCSSLGDSLAHCLIESLTHWHANVSRSQSLLKIRLSGIFANTARLQQTSDISLS